MKTETTTKKRIIYRGIVITLLQNGEYTWYDGDEKTLEECKREIDKEYGKSSPLGRAFSIT